MVSVPKDRVMDTEAITKALDIVLEEIITLKTLGYSTDRIEELVKTLKEELKANDSAALRTLRMVEEMVDGLWLRTFDEDSYALFMARMALTLEPETVEKLKDGLKGGKIKPDEWPKLLAGVSNILDNEAIVPFEFLGKKYVALKEASKRLIVISKKGMDVRTEMVMLNAIANVMRHDTPTAIRLLNNILLPQAAAYEDILTRRVFVQEAMPVVKDAYEVMALNTSAEDASVLLMNIVDVAVDLDQETMAQVLERLAAISRDSKDLKTSAYEEYITAALRRVDEYVSMMEDIGVRVNKKKIEKLKAKIKDLLDSKDMEKGLTATDTLTRQISEMLVKNYRAAMDAIITDMNNIRAEVAKDGLPLDDIDPILKKGAEMLAHIPKDVEGVIELHTQLRSLKEEFKDTITKKYLAAIKTMKEEILPALQGDMDRLEAVDLIAKDLTPEQRVDIAQIKQRFEMYQEAVSNVKEGDSKDIAEDYRSLSRAHAELRTLVREALDSTVKTIKSELQRMDSELSKVVEGWEGSSLKQIGKIVEGDLGKDIGTQYEALRKGISTSIKEHISKAMEAGMKDALTHLWDWERRIWHMETILHNYRSTILEDGFGPPDLGELNVVFISPMNLLGLWDTKVLDALSKFNEAKKRLEDLAAEDRSLHELIIMAKDAKVERKDLYDNVKRSTRLYVLRAMKDMIKAIKSDIEELKDHVPIDKKAFKDYKSAVKALKSKDIDKTYTLIESVMASVAEARLKLYIKEWKGRVREAFKAGIDAVKAITVVYDTLLKEYSEERCAIHIALMNGQWEEYVRSSANHISAQKEKREEFKARIKDIEEKVERVKGEDIDLISLISTYNVIRPALTDIQDGTRHEYVSLVRPLLEMDKGVVKATLKSGVLDENDGKAMMDGIEAMNRYLDSPYQSGGDPRALIGKLNEYLERRRQFLERTGKIAIEKALGDLRAILEAYRTIADEEGDLNPKGEGLITRLKDRIEGLEKEISHLASICVEGGAMVECAKGLSDAIASSKKVVSVDMELILGAVNERVKGYIADLKDMDIKTVMMGGNEVSIDNIEKDVSTLKNQIEDVRRAHEIERNLKRAVYDAYMSRYKALEKDLKKMLKDYKAKGMDIAPYLKEGARIEKAHLPGDVKGGYQALLGLKDRVDEAYLEFRKRHLTQEWVRLMDITQALAALNSGAKTIIKRLKALDSDLSKADLKGIDALEKDLKTIGDEVSDIRNSVLLEKARERMEAVRKAIDGIKDDPEITKLQDYIKEHFEVNEKESKGDLAYLYACKALNMAKTLRDQHYRKLAITTANNIATELKNVGELTGMDIGKYREELAALLKEGESTGGEDLYAKVMDVGERAKGAIEKELKRLTEALRKDISDITSKLENLGMETGASNIRAELDSIGEATIEGFKALKALSERARKDYASALSSALDSGIKRIQDYGKALASLPVLKDGLLPLKPLHSAHKALIKGLPKRSEIGISEDNGSIKAAEADMEHITAVLKTLESLENFLKETYEPMKRAVWAKDLMRETGWDTDNISGLEDELKKVWSRAVAVLGKGDAKGFDEVMKELKTARDDLIKEAERCLSEAYKKAADKRKAKAKESMDKARAEGVVLSEAEYAFKKAEESMSGNDLLMALYNYIKAEHSAEKAYYEHMRKVYMDKLVVYQEYIRRFEELKLEVDRKPLDDLYERAMRYIANGEFSRVDDAFLRRIKEVGEEVYNKGLAKTALSLMIQLQGIMEDLRARDIPAVETEKLLLEVEELYKNDMYLECIEKAREGIATSEDEIKKYEIDKAKERLNYLSDTISMLRDQGVDEGLLDTYLDTLKDLNKTLQNGDLEGFKARSEEVAEVINQQKEALVKDAEAYIISVEKYINAVKGLGINTRGPLNLLHHAKSEFEDGEYASAKKYAKKAKDYADELKLRYAPEKEIHTQSPEDEAERAKCVSLITTTWNIISKARDKGVDITESENVLNEARAALKKGDYEMGKEKARKALEMIHSALSSWSKGEKKEKKGDTKHGSKG